MEEDPVEVPIEDWIDLHTFRPQEIEGVVEEYLFQALRMGYAMVRIIHGRGIGLQREIVRQILNRHSEVVTFEDAPGRGATVAYLRPRI
jgi:dsDNA-specific endonuclease/ATPase MutS2